MRRRHLGLALSLLGGSLPLAGCQTFTPMPAGPQAPIAFEQQLDAPRSPEEAARTCLHTAEILDKNGREAEAIQGYEMARQQNPKFAHVSRRLAVLYDRQGNVPKAAEEYARALKAAPKDSDLLNDYGYFLYQQEKFVEAEMALRRAQQANPKNRRATVNLGLAVAQQRRYEDAFLIFTGAVGEAEAHANVGYVYALQGRREEATNAYRTALSLNPNLKQAQVAIETLTNPKPMEFKESSSPIAAEPRAPRGATLGSSAGRPATWNMRPPESRSAPQDRNPEEIVERLANFRKEHQQNETIQASKRPALAAPEDTPEPVKPAGASKSGLYDPAAERESASPPPPKRFIPSVKPITIPTPAGNSQE